MRNDSVLDNRINKSYSFSDIMKYNPNHDELGRFSSGIGGSSISIKNVVTGGFQGQTDAKLTAEIDGNVAGTLSYSEYEGEPHINMIETNPEYRGNGVATKMLQNLQSLYPGKNINTGMLTEDGSKLFEKVSEKVPNKEYSEVKRKLDNWKKELSRFESLSDEENANLSQKDGDRWNELYDLIEEGNTRLRGMREYDTFIKTTKSFNESNNNSSFQIAKADEDKRLVFGWALVSATSDGKQIIDHQGDIVDQDELEEGAYEYVLNFRDAGEEHIGSLRKKARMVESVVFTEEKLKAMGIPLGTVPYGWWIGFYVDDDNTWEMIKNGTYKMFSIEGRAIREPVNEPLAKSDNEDAGAVAKTFSELMKFNPYHDAKGRFTSGSGGSATSFTWRPGASAAHDKAIARAKEQSSGGGEIKAIRVTSPDGTVMTYRDRGNGRITNLDDVSQKNVNNLSIKQIHDRAKQMGYKVETFDDKQLKQHDSERWEERKQMDKFLTHYDVRGRGPGSSPRKGWKGH